MQDQDLERICKSLGYTTVAVYREHQGGNLTTSQIVHACDNLGESYSFDALTADQVVSLFIYVPPVNTTGPNIGTHLFLLKYFLLSMFEAYFDHS